MQNFGDFPNGYSVNIIFHMENLDQYSLETKYLAVSGELSFINF